MKKLFLTILTLTVAAISGLQAQIAVGQWRDHLSSTATYKVCVVDERVYASSANGLYYYDCDDYTVTRLNKTNLLNDVGISTIAYDPQSKCFVVAYNNANIDLIVDDKAINISDIKRGNISGSKKINNIRFRNHCAYLACGFGIVVVDLNRNEIKETYYLGLDGTYLNVNDLAFKDTLIVAATDIGIMTAPADSRLLHISNTWTNDTSSLLAGMNVKMLAVDCNNKLIVGVHDDTDGTNALFREVGPLSFAPWITGNLRAVRMSEGKIITVFDDCVKINDCNYQTEFTLGTLDWFRADVNDAVLSHDGRLWMAHNWASMAVCVPDNPEATLNAVSPDGPASDDVFSIVSYNNDLMVCPGGHRTTYVGTFLPANIHSFNDNKWRTLEDPDNLLENKLDLIHVAVNPRNNKQKMAALWGSGIAEINDNKVTNIYNTTNSDGALTAYTENSYTSLFTGGVAFDRDGNLWVTNSLQPNGLAVRKSNGSWQSFNTLSMVAGSDIDNIIYDSIYGNKLFWGRANKIFVHNGTDKMSYIDPNNGAKMETSSVNCVVQDHNGNIWIGTNKGIKVIYDLYRVFNNGGQGEKSPSTCSNILYNENGINEYLLAYESITCIVVDGANRKWVGTSNGGVYLLSGNGLQQLEHFTTANSHLFSDKIVSLSVMPWTGELFIGTDKGIQSYRSTATYAYATPSEDIHAFPNPVKPDYDGVISIKGFSRNALVHITDAAGHTVYSTKANGGQATWNGCTNSGKRVASGVYYVFASSEDGDMRSVTKILIIK